MRRAQEKMVDPAGEVVARPYVGISEPQEPARIQVAQRAFQAPLLAVDWKRKARGVRHQGAGAFLAHAGGEPRQGPDLACERRFAERPGRKLVSGVRKLEQRWLACTLESGLEQPAGERAARQGIRQERLVVRQLLLSIAEREAHAIAQQEPARAHEKIAELLDPYRAPLRSGR